MIYTVDSKTVYEWFYLKRIPTFYVNIYAEYFDLQDDELDITLTDLKNVLCMMKSGEYTFEQIYEWTTFFFYIMHHKLTYNMRHQKIFVDFEPWEVGFDDQELEYVIYCLLTEVEVLDDKDRANDVASLYPYIDDLLLDIDYFEKEDERGSVMRHHFSKTRIEAFKGRI